MVVLAGLVAHFTGWFPGDQAVLSHKHGKPPLAQPVDAIVNALDTLASAPAVVLIVLALSALAWRALGPLGLIVGLCPLAAVAVAAALKPLFGPSELEERYRWPVDTFPSGHAAFAAGAAGVGAWLALRAGRTALAVAFAVLALAVGVAQVVQSAHWPSDVVGGWALGLAAVAAALAVALAPSDRRGGSAVSASGGSTRAGGE